MSSWRLLIVDQGPQLTCDLLLYVAQQSVDSNAPVLDLDLWTSQSSKQEAPDVWCEMWKGETKAYYWHRANLVRRKRKTSLYRPHT